MWIPVAEPEARGGESRRLVTSPGMRSGIRNLKVNRERAVRLAAIAALAVLGISTLPGLLRTPEPPPVPANVGFRPSEISHYLKEPARSGTGQVPERKTKDTTRSKRLAASKRAAKQRQERRAMERAKMRERRSKDQAKASRKRRRSSGTTVGSSVAISPSPPNPVAAAPASVYAPPPAPAPVPAPPPAMEPGDGSQEFAPR